MNDKSKVRMDTHTHTHTYILWVIEFKFVLGFGINKNGEILGLLYAFKMAMRR